MRLIRSWFAFADSFNPWGPTGIIGATLNVAFVGVLIWITLPGNPTPWGVSAVCWVALIAVAIRAWILIARSRRRDSELRIKMK